MVEYRLSTRKGVSEGLILDLSSAESTTAVKATGPQTLYYKGKKRQRYGLRQVQGVQTENHLNTIQNESIKTNTKLDDLIKEQAETNGYLRAIAERK